MRKMKITYEEPLDKEIISLLTIFALFLLAVLLIVNIDPEGVIAIKSVLNMVLVPALIFMIFFIGEKYFTYLVKKTPLNQIISKYDDFSYDYGHRIKNFYVNHKEMDVYNYIKLDKMPKNIAPYFVGDKTNAK